MPSTRSASSFINEVVGEVEVPQQIELDVLTVKELKSIAKEKGIECYSDMKKSELIECLK